MADCNTSGDRRGWLDRLRQYRRSETGTAAVEFAFVSIPFFAMLFAIIETAMVFFVGQMLDTGTSQIARLIRTGQAHQGALTEADMAKTICSNMISIEDCSSNLHIDVRQYNSFAAASLVNPIDKDGKFVGLQYNIGKSSEIIVVRAYYTWPVFFRLLTPDPKMPDGKRLLGSVAAFRNEPFPW